MANFSLLPTFCGNFFLLLLPYLGKIGNGQHTTDKGSYPNEVGLATVCLVSFAALFLDVPQRSPKVLLGERCVTSKKRLRGRGRLPYVTHTNIFMGKKALYTTKYLREILFLILTENSFQFCGNNYLQTRGWNNHGNKDGRCFCWTFPAGVSGPDFKWRARGDGDVLMGAKIKPKTIPKAFNKTQKSSWIKINPQKIPCRISEP